MRRTTTRAIGALMVLASTAANAGVVYRWHDLTFNQNLGPIEAFIEIDNDYWTPGGTIQWDSSQAIRPTSEPYMLKPDWLERFSFRGTAPPTGTTPLGLNERGTCGDRLDCGVEYEGIELIYGYFGFDLTFNSLMTGSMNVNDTGSNIRMKSNGQVWTLGEFSTDGWPGPCFTNGAANCSGNTGLWVLDISTVPAVPEAEALAMMMLGFALVVGVARRPKD